MDWGELAQVQWRHPWGAALVLLWPVLLGWLARRRRQQLARYADAHLLPWAVQQGPASRAFHLRRVAELLGWLLLAVATAGPRLPLPSVADDRPGARAPHVVDVMVVLDVSASMSAQDVAPDRITRARLELHDLLRRLHGERLGLLIYAGQAGLVLPPTDDPAVFTHALQPLDASVLDGAGTDLARALTLARTQLPPGPTARGRAVLLISDAEEDSLQGTRGEAAAQAVEALRAEGIPLFVLVTASEAGSTFELPNGTRAQRDGAPAVSRPAVAEYRRLARRSGGDLSLLLAGDAHWVRLFDDGLAQLPGAAVPAAHAQAWRELYAWPLLLALVLLGWSSLPPALRRGSTVSAPAVLLAVMVGAVLPEPARAAQELPLAQAAAEAYRSGQWAQALPLFERQGGYAGAMGAGASAWKLRDFAGAGRHFAQALLLARSATERDDALYNLGSAHYAQEQWLAAAQAWRAVLLSRPDDKRAEANLAHAETQLARRAGTPMKSDLRGRLGFSVEGFVGMDGLVQPREEALMLQNLAPGARGNEERSAAGAQARAATAGDAAQEVDVGAQQLQSGLLKLERVQEQRRELWRGLLRQDRQPTPAGSTGAAW